MQLIHQEHITDNLPRGGDREKCAGLFVNLNKFKSKYLKNTDALSFYKRSASLTESYN